MQTNNLLTDHHRRLWLSPLFQQTTQIHTPGSHTGYRSVRFRAAPQDLQDVLQ